jgi:hypothetical protein
MRTPFALLRYTVEMKVIVPLCAPRVQPFAALTTVAAASRSLPGVVMGFILEGKVLESPADGA